MTALPPSLDRFGPERALAANYAAGILFIAAVALVAMPYLLLVVVIFFSGMTIIGSQTGANAACGKLYPARMRTSGLGWALGIGRLGGIAAPVLGGYLLSMGLPPRQIFLSACFLALVAATATALLVFRGSRAERLLGPAASPAGRAPATSVAGRASPRRRKAMRSRRLARETREAIVPVGHFS